MSATDPTHREATEGETTRSWAALAGHLEAFIQAWDNATEPPRLAAFLPTAGTALRLLALTELIKVDLEYRWLRRGLPRRLDEYLQEFPDLAHPRIPSDLIYEEFHVRKQSGDAVETREYLERYGDQAAELGRLLDMESPQRSTAFASQVALAQVSVNQRLDDFNLLMELGRGAFATVFLAQQRSMNRIVALKVSADRGTEPQTLALLDHPHVVRVFDQRILADRSLRLLYVQYVPGGTLQAVIEWARRIAPHQRCGQTVLDAIDDVLVQRGEVRPVRSVIRARLAEMPWPEVTCWLGARLAAALDHAHARGVLHRDVKPANVLMTAEGSPKLADFNVSFSSKWAGANPAAYFGGSLAYMSPEQLEAFNPAHPRTPESLDARSDLFSLGVLLWELLTTSRPFPPESLEPGWQTTLERLTATRRTGLPADAAAQLPPQCPPDLRQALLSCLAPDPDQRPRSCLELARRLELCRRPGTQRLFSDPAPGWCRLVQRFPLATVTLTALLPNLLAALFNLAYNRHEIVTRLATGQDSHAQGVFWTIQFLINGIAFPLGIALVAWLGRPVAQGLRMSKVESAGLATTLRRSRQRCLSWGHYVAIIGITEWSIAGLAYPVCLRVLLGPMPWEVYVHFAVSLALCGMIAAVYPFFGVTYLCVRALYPCLQQVDAPEPEEKRLWGRLRHQTLVYLLMAAAVPMLAVTILVTFVGATNRLALGVLGLCGLLGFGMAFGLFRAIHHGLDAITEANAPLNELLSMTEDTFASSWHESGALDAGGK